LYSSPPHTAPHTLPLHDALPISNCCQWIAEASGNVSRGNPIVPNVTIFRFRSAPCLTSPSTRGRLPFSIARPSRVVSWGPATPRSEEHTSELQSRSDLVCRLLLE